MPLVCILTCISHDRSTPPRTHTHTHTHTHTYTTHTETPIRFQHVWEGVDVIRHECRISYNSSTWCVQSMDFPERTRKSLIRLIKVSRNHTRCTTALHPAVCRVDSPLGKATARVARVLPWTLLFIEVQLTRNNLFDHSDWAWRRGGGEWVGNVDNGR